MKKRTELSDLSPEQQEVVGIFGRGLAVMAGAGSGKTTTLVIKCEEFLKIKPEARLAAVSFTERSASDLRAKLSERIGSLSRHWVTTIHGLCGAILREYPREAGYDGEESVLSESEARALWERALESLWFDDLPPEVDASLALLLETESRDAVEGLLARARELSPFGALEKLASGTDERAQALAKASAHVLDRYERLKRRRGALDFNDLERGADRALAHPEVRRAFQKRFDLVLVDEFQDTNPLQAGIIRRFCREDGSNLCVVGDPKQSIYRFRDADVSVFEEFCSSLPENRSLTWNFRSRPGIIDYTNAVCEKAFEGSMRYDALVPKREPGEEHDPVLRLELKEPAELARWIRAEVARGVPLADMALLLRKIRGNEKWLKALTGTGIPIAVGSGGLFWEDPRVREMTAFLKWWDQPRNSLSGAIFLRAPWMGISDLELDAWVAEDPTFEKPFFASAHPLAKRLAAFRGRAVRPGELLLALLYAKARPDESEPFNEEVEKELGAPLLGLWHRSEELSSRGLDFHSAVRELSRAMEEGRRDRDVPPPRNEGILSVLTLHSSKGLEFPHVILVDFGPKPRAADAPLLFWDRKKGAALGVRDEDGDRDKDAEAEWREEEKQKGLAESKRLFYVALTRARERLILVCPELPEKAPPKKAPVEVPSPFASDDWRGWIDEAPLEVLSASAPEAAPEFSAPSRETHQLARSRLHPVLKRPRHSVTEWNMLSRCPRAYEWTYIRPRTAPAPLEWNGKSSSSLSQRELGSRVHSCLERRDFDGLKQLETEAGSERFQSAPVIEWASASEWMKPSSAETWSELAFEIPVAGEVLVGSLDRVVERPEGYRIIDFKVTRAEKSEAELLEAYRTQLELYAYAMRVMDPQSKKVEAALVNLSPDGIQEVEVRLGDLRIESLAREAAEIVAGREATPRPGSLCRYCEFRSQCLEAAPKN